MVVSHGEESVTPTKVKSKRMATTQFTGGVVT